MWVLICASDYYVRAERLVSTAKELSEFFREVREIADRDDCDAYWRGQVDHRWGVSSSLARMAILPAALTDETLANAEKALLADAKKWITSLVNPPVNNLEWLALLQHHGIPTRLIDFTPNPLVATFFASESADDVEGRIFAVLVPRAGMRLTDTDVDAFEFTKVPKGQLRLWQPGAHVSPRIAAQSGVFALSRLPSTQVARHVEDKSANPTKRLLLQSEVVSIMSIPLYILPLATARRSSSTVLSCFTAKIHVDKTSIRNQLSKKANRGDLRPTGAKIDHAYCYPDIDGMNRYSRALENVRRGIGGP